MELPVYSCQPSALVVLSQSTAPQYVGAAAAVSCVKLPDEPPAAVESYDPRYAAMPVGPVAASLPDATRA